LQNWLEGRAVRARPLGADVRAWRWIRRHAAKFLASAISLMVVVGIASYQAFDEGGQTADVHPEPHQLDGNPTVADLTSGQDHGKQGGSSEC